MTAPDLEVVRLKHPVTISGRLDASRTIDHVMLRLPNTNGLRVVKFRAMFIARGKRDVFCGLHLVAAFTGLPVRIVSEFQPEDRIAILERMDDHLAALTGIPREQFRFDNINERLGRGT